MNPIVKLLLLSTLTGCVSTEAPKLKPPELPIAEMKLPVAIDTKAEVVPDKPRGKVFILRKESVDGVEKLNLLPREGTVKIDGDITIMVFEQDGIKRLNLIHNSAKANESLVYELNRLQLLNLRYAESIQGLAALEEARVARLEADLNYAEHRIKQATWEKNIETWTWKIVAILALVIGI